MRTFAVQNNCRIMRKNFTLLSTVALAATFLVACGPSEAEILAAKEKVTADSLTALASMERTVAIDMATSKVNWTGTMLGIKSHNGNVTLSEAKLMVKGPTVTGGSFTVDLGTIAAVDEAYAPDGSAQGTRSMLHTHLASAEFFDVANHPTAMFNITSVEGNTATGNLTIRGITNEEKITDINLTETNGAVTATGKLAFDRQKYGMVWSSGSKDAVLNDKVELDITLNGNLQ